MGTLAIESRPLGRRRMLKDEVMPQSVKGFCGKEQKLTKSWSTSDDVGHLLSQLIGHEADDGKYYKTGED